MPLRMDAVAQVMTQVARGYQPRPMSQKNEQPEPSSSPSTRQVIITLPAWPSAQRSELKAQQCNFQQHPTLRELHGDRVSQCAELSVLG